MTKKFQLCLSVISVIFGMLPFAAYAESVVWSTVVQTGVCPVSSFGTCTSDGEGIWVLENVSAQVTYSIRVTNATTGAVIPKGSTVPAGTRVKYEFVPHKYTDVYWVGTGGWYDSPYGVWAGKESENDIYNSSNYVNGAYVTLSVVQPSKTLSGLPSGCETTSDGVSKICTLQSPGTVSAVFNFAKTPGTFLIANGNGFDIRTPAHPMGRMTGMFDGNFPIAESPYAVQVTAQSINYPLTVEAAANTAPISPTLGSDGACVVGQSHSISMTSSDPDGDQIRYGIDWNADGSVDEWMPSTGYVPSGTSQSASRTYATEGSKTVKVLVEDDGGLASDWASISFTCTSTPPEEEDPENPSDDPGSNSGDSCPVGYTLQNNTCVFAGCPAGYTLQGGTCIQNPQCSSGPPGFYCVGNQVWQRTAQCTDLFDHTCQAGWSCVAGQCIPPQVGGTISATPILVRSGDSSTITWTSSEMESCSVSSVPPSVPQSADNVGLSGSFLSSPLFQRTVFTLFCNSTAGDPFSRSATVNILPTFQEN